jgi:hypothetical protein
MANVDPELSALRSEVGRIGGLTRVANLDEAGHAAHAQLMLAARRRIQEIADEIDPDRLLDSKERHRQARLRYDIEKARAKVADLTERRRRAELAELTRLAELSA